MTVNESSQEVTVVPTESYATPIERLLEQAIAKGVGPDGIAKLAEVYQSLERQRAVQDYTVAMSALQQDMPPVVKRSQVAFKTKRGAEFAARYASLEDIARICKPVILQHGFTFRFDTAIENRQVTVSCEVSHVGGHSKVTTFSAPVDQDPALSAAHSTASATSFAQRYAFLLAFGIVPQGADDNGRAGFVGDAVVTDFQAHELRRLAEETDALGPKFWAFCGVETFSDIKAADYPRIRQALVDRLRKRGKK